MSMRATHLARIWCLVALALWGLAASASAQAVNQTVARCGKGWLETIDG